MTIATTTTKVAYAGNDVTTAFAVTFPFFGAAELTVIERAIATGAETVKTLTTHYSVAGGAGTTGTVTMVAAPASSVELHIRRNTLRTQASAYPTNDPLPSATIERDNDRAIALIQELEEITQRAIVLAKSSAYSMLSVPDPVAAKLLRWKADLSGLENVDLTGSGSISVPVSIAQGGTSQTTALAAFDALKQAASETYTGIAELATQAETDAGTDDARIVTAKKLAAWPQARGGWKNAARRNGSFMDWSRGAGGAASHAVAASTTAYTANGWVLTTNANQASVVDQVAGIETGSRYACRVRRNSGQTGTGTYWFELPLDTDEIVPLRGQPVTLSLTVIKGANYSPASSILGLTLYTGTGAPAKRVLGAYTGEVVAISQNQAITGSAVRYSFTSASLGASIAQASLVLNWTPVGTAGAADDFTIGDIDLRPGTAAGLIERPTLNECLLFGRPHFRKTFPYPTAPAQSAGLAGARVYLLSAGGTVVAGGSPGWEFSPSMRATPTIVFFNPAAANAFVRNETRSTDATTTAANTHLSSEIVDWTQTGLAAWTATDSLGVHITADSGI